VTGDPLAGALGTRLRAVLDAMDADVARTLTDLGVADFRTRFSAVVRAIATFGPSSIRDVAAALGVTHSAASQTVAEMAHRDLVQLARGATDARQRLVHLTDKGERLLPAIDAEWSATAAAMSALDAELSAPLSRIIAELNAALERRPFRQRIADAAATMSTLDPALRSAITGDARG